jgi:uncharacterized protein (TIGR03435 family)
MVPYLIGATLPGGAGRVSGNSPSRIPRMVRDDPVASPVGVQEQLGLKLESTKGPVDVLVIDHVDRPTED